jgi:hypothetical protein
MSCRTPVTKGPAAPPARDASTMVPKMRRNGPVNLDRVPGIQPTEEAESEPPVTRGSHRAGKHPVHSVGRPGRIHHVGNGAKRCAGCGVAIGLEPHILRPLAHQMAFWLDACRPQAALSWRRCAGFSHNLWRDCSNVQTKAISARASRNPRPSGQNRGESDNAPWCSLGSIREAISGQPSLRRRLQPVRSGPGSTEDISE